MIAAEVVPLADQVGPFLPILGVIFGGLIVGAFGVYNRRKNNVEVKVPSVSEVWAKQVEQSEKLDAEIVKRRELEEQVEVMARQLRQVTRDKDAYVSAFEGLRDTFKKFAARVQGGGSANLTKAEKAALELPVVSDDDAWPTITKQQLRELQDSKE